MWVLCWRSFKRRRIERKWIFYSGNSFHNRILFGSFDNDLKFGVSLFHPDYLRQKIERMFQPSPLVILKSKRKNGNDPNKFLAQYFYCQFHKIWRKLSSRGILWAWNEKKDKKISHREELDQFGWNLAAIYDKTLWILSCMTQADKKMCVTWMYMKRATFSAAPFTQARWYKLYYLRHTSCLQRISSYMFTLYSGFTFPQAIVGFSHEALRKSSVDRTKENFKWLCIYKKCWI